MKIASTPSAAIACATRSPTLEPVCHPGNLRRVGEACCRRACATRRARSSGCRTAVRSTAVDLDVVFLGTAGSAPTARRAASATLVRRGGDRLLVDCGEGTQRQLLRSDVGLVDLEEVFLTHLHADHFLGLPGMLKTFALRGRDVPLTLHGPVGTRALLDALRRIFGRLTYELDVVELAPGDLVERDGYRLEAIAVAHGVDAIGYALREDARPGRFDVEHGRPPRRAERGCTRRAAAR